MNSAVESESASSYLSCYSNENARISTGEQSKTFTNTKSRLYIRYDDDRSSEDNIRKLKSGRNQSAESSTTTLCVRQERRILLEQKDKPSEKSSPLKSTSQTTHNQPFDVDRFRRSSNREISSTIVKKSTRTERNSFFELPLFHKSSQSKKGSSQNLVPF